jgi:hypothetical protein
VRKVDEDGTHWLVRFADQSTEIVDVELDAPVLVSPWRPVGHLSTRGSGDLVERLVAGRSDDDTMRSVAIESECTKENALLRSELLEMRQRIQRGVGGGVVVVHVGKLLEQHWMSLDFGVLETHVNPKTANFLISIIFECIADSERLGVAGTEVCEIWNVLVLGKVTLQLEGWERQAGEPSTPLSSGGQHGESCVFWLKKQ